MGDDSTRSMAAGAGSAGREQQLYPGEVLAGRFTIIQFIARGGMGEVYEAADQYFQNRHFALKTLREGIADDPVIRQRFEREVLLAREVRHDNVCPSYDLFHVDGPRGRIMFLTMKLLRGESLAARLGRSGRLDVESALPIVRQMADALDAAHHAGVIHHDFKPGNVMLEQSGKDAHVSITDFGLSRLYEADASLTEAGHISGTLGYIAPELLQGRTATPASDVYSFGVVLYEVLTGRRPGYKSWKEECAPPSALTEGVPPAWDRMVLGCLEQDPASRFQTAGEALGALTGANPGTRPITVRTPVSRWRKAAAAALAALAIAVAGWFGWPKVYGELHPLPQQRFVALMAWPTDPNPENRALLKSVLDTIAGRLGRAEAKSKDLLIISPGDVPGQAPPKGPREAVSALGANLALAATLRSSGGRFTLSLKVVDAVTGKVLRDREVRCAAQALGRLPESAAAAAADLLDVTLPGGRLTDAEELARVGPAAFQAFSSAEDLVSQANDSGLDQAIDKYQKALDADPRFALAYARISMAYARKSTQTQDAAALTLAAKNADQALYYNPDSAKAALSRAMVDLYSGKTQQALDGIGHALRLDPGNPRILLYKAVAFRYLDKRAEEEGVYREVIRERPNYWPAYNELGGILHRHGNDKEAAEAFAEASAVAPRAAMPLTNLGTVYMLLGRSPIYMRVGGPGKQSLLNPQVDDIVRWRDNKLQAVDPDWVLGYSPCDPSYAGKHECRILAEFDNQNVAYKCPDKLCDPEVPIGSDVGGGLEGSIGHGAGMAGAAPTEIYIACDKDHPNSVTVAPSLAVVSKSQEGGAYWSGLAKATNWTVGAWQDPNGKTAQVCNQDPINQGQPACTLSPTAAVGTTYSYVATVTTANACPTPGTFKLQVNP